MDLDFSGFGLVQTANGSTRDLLLVTSETVHDSFGSPSEVMVERQRWLANSGFSGNASDDQWKERTMVTGSFAKSLSLQSAMMMKFSIL